MSIPVTPWRPLAIDRHFLAGRGSACHAPMMAIGDDGAAVYSAVEAGWVHIVMVDR